MNKKRKIEGDNLEALGQIVACLRKTHTDAPTGQNEETRAFYNTYHQDLVGDEDDNFKHLQDVPMEDDGDEPDQMESVTVDEIRECARKVARNLTVRGCQLTLHTRPH